MVGLGVSRISKSFSNLQKLTLTPRFLKSYLNFDDLKDDDDGLLNEKMNRIIRERKDLMGEVEYGILSGLIKSWSVSGAKWIKICLTG